MLSFIKSSVLGAAAAAGATELTPLSTTENCIANGEHLSPVMSPYWEQRAQIHPYAPNLTPCAVDCITEFFLNFAPMFKQSSEKTLFEMDQLVLNPHVQYSDYFEQIIAPHQELFPTSLDYEALRRQAKSVDTREDITSIMGDLASVTAYGTLILGGIDMNKLVQLYCPNELENEKCSAEAFSDLFVDDESLTEDYLTCAEKYYSYLDASKTFLNSEDGKFIHSKFGEGLDDIDIEKLEASMKYSINNTEIAPSIDSVLTYLKASKAYKAEEPFYNYSMSRARSTAKTLSDKIQKNPELKETIEKALIEARVITHEAINEFLQNQEEKDSFRTKLLVSYACVATVALILLNRLLPPNPNRAQ